jgi:hypothetical protein
MTNWTISPPMLYGENSEATQLDAVVALQSLLHRIEDRVDGLFGLRLAHAGSGNDPIDQIDLDHLHLPVTDSYRRIFFETIFLPLETPIGNGNQAGFMDSTHGGGTGDDRPVQPHPGR